MRRARGRRLRRARRRARHAGRARHLDAGDRQDVPRLARADRRVRQPGRLERRFGGRRDRPGRRRSRDGAADEHRLLDPDLDERPGLLEGSAAQGRQRRCRLRRRARTRARPKRRRPPRRWCGRPPTTAPARRPRRTSSTSSHRRSRPCSTRSTARSTQPKGSTLDTAGATVDDGRDVVLAAGARHADRPEHHRADALARGRRPARRALESRARLPGTVGAISLLVGLYGLQVLPVSVAGVLLLLLSLGLFVDRRSRDRRTARSPSPAQ